MESKRLSGVLCHPTSFPSPYGVGDLGGGARDFIDFLYKSGQSIWQVLPLNPTGYGDSPYQSFSTHAGNGLLISPELLVEEGLLEPSDLAVIPDEIKSGDAQKVDYGAVITYKNSIYKKAYANFINKTQTSDKKAFDAFCLCHGDWLDDYALFTAIKDYYIGTRKNQDETPELTAYNKAYGAYLPGETDYLDYYYGAVWNSWPSALARREEYALKQWRADLAEETDFVKFVQFTFYKQWSALKDYANKHDILVVGDMPIFVAFDSADVWVHKEMFQMKGLRPSSVAGVPPDYFSETGQLWGNPLYNWENHAGNGFEWWIKRIKHTLELVDIVRIDHFRGFEGYWSIPGSAKTAVKGKWIKAPGKALFEAVKNALGDVPLIAEDLGVITPAVTELRRSFGFPGMKVLQFAFEGGTADPYLPHNYEESGFVVYTGTHDNDTTAGWYAAAGDEIKDYYRRYLNVSGETPGWDMIRLAMSSSAQTAVFPIWDVLEQDGSHRMNIPGTKEGNWRYRYVPERLEAGYAEGLAYLSKLFNRNQKPEAEPDGIESDTNMEL